MRIEFTTPQGETCSLTLSVPKNSRLTVVMPEGVDARVEGAFTAQESACKVQFNGELFDSAPNNVVDCGAGVGDQGGLGRIGGVGERKDREDKGAREGERAEPSLAEMEFPILGGAMWRAGDLLVEDLVLAYGESTVQRCFKKAKAWLTCNPERRKTPRGMPKFLNRWLAFDDKPTQQTNNSLTKDVRTTAKIVKGRPTVEGW